VSGDHQICAAEIVVREIAAPDELRAVEQLQKEVWGIPDLDVVPLTQLVAAKAAGGVLLGAFDGGALIGFVYGFVGYEKGHTTHHSHMLAVRPDYRNFSVGFKLKHAQRNVVSTQGITQITWTFDPLQSLNAYLNFSRLGVISDRYLIDFYGIDAASFLHRSGTDRLWVTWPLNSLNSDKASKAEIDIHTAEAIIEIGENNAPKGRELDYGTSGDHLSIEIPADINSIQRQDPSLSALWREATRFAFTDAFAAGYVAIDFVRGDPAGKYILCRGETLDDIDR
jgi:predicted GNAT superfamily acetyltransferase